MKLIVGLGNPGPKYETTRHNVGFLAIDRMVDEWKAGAPENKFNAEISYASVSGQKVALMKPKTFMNLSGQAVAPFMNFYKLVPDDLVVIHDDLDLPPMSLKIKTGGGTGGHNGLKSLEECLGSEQTDYHRIRVGIGHPAALGLKIKPVDYVLQAYSDQELGELDPLLDKIVDATQKIVSGNVLAAMTLYNRKD